MSFLARFLGQSENRNFADEPRSMQPLLSALAELDVDRARYLSAFAYVLSRVAAADRVDADLIIMGRRGLSDFTGLVIGSTSHKVGHLAPCACLTTR